MSNGNPQKVHINPAFLPPITSERESSQIYINPAFVAKSNSTNEYNTKSMTVINKDSGNSLVQIQPSNYVQTKIYVSRPTVATSDSFIKYSLNNHLKTNKCTPQVEQSMKSQKLNTNSKAFATTSTFYSSKPFNSLTKPKMKWSREAANITGNSCFNQSAKQNVVTKHISTNSKFILNNNLQRKKVSNNINIHSKYTFNKQVKKVLTPKSDQKYFKVISKQKIIRCKSKSPTSSKQGFATFQLQKFKSIKPGNTSAFTKKLTSKNNSGLYMKNFNRSNKLRKVKKVKYLNQLLANSVKEKHKLINRPAKIKRMKYSVSNYKICRLNSNSTGKKCVKVQTKLGIKNKQHCFGITKSDKFVRIGNSMYKATKTKLQRKTYDSNKIHECSSKGSSNVTIKIGGTKFILGGNGKSLKKICDVAHSTSSSSIPSDFLSKVYIGGLTFTRSQAGRYDLSKSNHTKLIAQHVKQKCLYTIQKHRKFASMHQKEYCMFYNRYGKCYNYEKGTCQYFHDPMKIAICTRFLRGRCPVSNCPFSHKVDPDKMPVCSHFMKGSCGKEKCLYRHVRVNPKAPFCEQFIKGHCSKGQECKKQHILLCPDFNSTGTCSRGKSCPLSHRKVTKQKGILTNRKKKQLSSIKLKGTLGLLYNTNVTKGCKNNGQRYFESDDKNTNKFEKYNSHKCQENVNNLNERKFDSKNKDSIDEKRKRLLSKIEVMKQNYLRGSDMLPSFSICDEIKEKQSNLDDRKNKFKEVSFKLTASEASVAQESPVISQNINNSINLVAAKPKLQASKISNDISESGKLLLTTTGEPTIDEISKDARMTSSPEFKLRRFPLPLQLPHFISLTVTQEEIDKDDNL